MNLLIPPAMSKEHFYNHDFGTKQPINSVMLLNKEEEEEEEEEEEKVQLDKQVKFSRDMIL